MDNAPVYFSGDGSSPGPREYVETLHALLAAGRLKPDSYGQGGSVRSLEREMARRLGKEEAVYMPTGTLANLLAVRALSAGRSRVVVQGRSHLYSDAGDGAAVLAGLTLVRLGAGRLCFTPAELEREIDRVRSGKVPSEIGAVSIETPVRRDFNRAVPFAQLKALTRRCRRGGIGTHLDGARLFLTGLPARKVAALFDTVYISLYKYFGAPSGAVLAGPRRLLRRVRDDRRMFGGSQAESYLQAALALEGMKDFEPRYAAARAHAAKLFHRLGRRVRIFADGTNIAVLKVPQTRARKTASRLRDEGIRLGAYRPESGGFALHINETLLRRPEQELAESIRRALRP